MHSLRRSFQVVATMRGVMYLNLPHSTGLALVARLHCSDSQAGVK
jgi:hypothetical protein